MSDEFSNDPGVRAVQETMKAKLALRKEIADVIDMPENTIMDYTKTADEVIFNVLGEQTFVYDLDSNGNILPDTLFHKTKPGL